MLTAARGKHWRQMPKRIEEAMNEVPNTAQIAAQFLGEYVCTVIDVGARFGAQGVWWRVPPLTKLVGFEPDAEECTRLNAAANERERFVPLGLGKRGGTGSLFRTAVPGCSSLYPPLEELCERYPDLACIRKQSTQKVKLVTLDKWAAQDRTDDVCFMKLDTQGSELDILMGAERMLTTCLGLEVEVEFNPIYEGQPLFSDVDRFLRERGFVLWRLNHLCHYAEQPSGIVPGEDDPVYGGYRVSHKTGVGRLYWADAVYFKDYAQFAASESSVRQLLLLASLLHAAGDPSAALACLRRVLEWNCLGLSASAPTVLAAHVGLLDNALRSVEPWHDRNLTTPPAIAPPAPTIQIQHEESAAAVHELAPEVVSLARRIHQVSVRYPRLAARVRRLLRPLAARA